MNAISRRDVLRTGLYSGAATVLSAPAIKAAKLMRTDVRIKDISYAFEDFTYRAPYKFGGRSVDRVTILNVSCAVEDGSGRIAHGSGSMTLSNTWAFPSDTMPYAVTLGAMTTLAKRAARIASGYHEYGHPVDIALALAPEYLKAASSVSAELKLTEPIPKLCTLVTTSPFDTAVHDAFGKLHGVNCYHTFGPEFMSKDLGQYIGPAFKGEYLSQYVLKDPVPKVALYHSVGASDPIVASDIHKRINDGLPETLPEWIEYNGLRRIKIKLNGNDLAWDLARVVSIDRATTETQARLNVKEWFYSLDFNERCPNVQYLLDFLHRLKQATPSGFTRIQYIEQPTRRDLNADRQNVMFEAAKLRPIVIDESLTGIDMLLLARDMGYTGAALKVCKGLSQALLESAVAQRHRMFLCVQDLTCPGESLIHSVGLAAHTPGISALEANSREYVPIANKPWQDRYPGIFVVRDGFMRTSELTGPGLSAG